MFFRENVLTSRNPLGAIGSLSGAGKSTFLDFIATKLCQLQNFSSADLTNYFKELNLPMSNIEYLRNLLSDHPLINIPITFNKNTNLEYSKDMRVDFEIAVRVIYTMLGGGSQSDESMFIYFKDSIDPSLQKILKIDDAMLVVINHFNSLHPKDSSIKSPVLVFLVDELARFSELGLSDDKALYKKAVSNIGRLSDSPKFLCVSFITTLDSNFTQEAFTQSNRPISWIGFNLLDYEKLFISNSSVGSGFFIELIKNKRVGSRIPYEMHVDMLNSLGGHGMAIKLYFKFLVNFVPTSDFEIDNDYTLFMLMGSFYNFAVVNKKLYSGIILEDIYFLKNAILCKSISKKSPHAKYYFNSSFTDMKGDFVPKLSQFLLFCYARIYKTDLARILNSVLNIDVIKSGLVSGALIELFIARILNLRRYLLTYGIKNTSYIKLSDYVGEYTCHEGDNSSIDSEFKIRLFAPKFIENNYSNLKSTTFVGVDKFKPIRWIGKNHPGFDLVEGCKTKVNGEFVDTILCFEVRSIMPDTLKIPAELSKTIGVKLDLTSKIITDFYKGDNVPPYILCFVTMKNIPSTFNLHVKGAPKYVIINYDSLFKMMFPFSTSVAIRKQYQNWDDNNKLK